MTVLAIVFLAVFGLQVLFTFVVGIFLVLTCNTDTEKETIDEISTMLFFTVLPIVGLVLQILFAIDLIKERKEN